jgi:DNA polymerase I-like protein with 3'-5' exonuclease and polymerase domains
MRLVFDIETDGLLRELSVIHCIVARDLDTNQEYRWDNGDIPGGLKFLGEADELWGHNVVGFDCEAIKELNPDWTYKGKLFDTLILSRLFFTDLLDKDFRTKPANMPAQLYGRHSLEAWGHRLSVHKSEFGKSLDGDWSTYTPEMLEYCSQDVAVSVRVCRMFEPKLEQYKDCIETEHRIALLMAWQEREGFPFDVQGAQLLESKLRTELDQISDEMRDTFLFVDGGLFTPKRGNSTRGYVEGAAMCKLKEFSPTSRDHIAWAFETFRGWEATERTPSGRAKIDDTVLKEIGTPEALKFSRILELQKHLGQLSDGKNAWLKLEKRGRIHHSCILNTNTGRQAHLKPNLAQVPSASEYRALFGPGDGRVQVASDASGLELRCLGHYLHPFDNGKFSKEVVEGDIHTSLAEIYGTDRKTGKSCTYCLIYGGGNTKLGLTAGASKASAAHKGKEIRKRILDGLDGYKQLSEAIQERATATDTLKGLDGRPIRLQGKHHASLNYLLQSAGAIICKSWLIRAYELLDEAGIDYWPLAFVHDELQISVSPNQVAEAEFLITASLKDIEHKLKFRCALDSEAQHGATWADCH